jgi:hypothetical protein
VRCFSVLVDGAGLFRSSSSLDSLTTETAEVTTGKAQSLRMRARAEEQKGFSMTIHWFSVRSRALVFLAVMVLSVTATQAQSDTASDSNASCGDVKPPIPNPADAYQGVQLYLVSPGAPQHQSVCQATEALAAGMVDIAFDDDAVLADALGDPVPDTDIGEVSKFPSPGPGSTATPAPLPPGLGPELTDGAHFYAAFVDPTTGVEYTFSSVADSVDDMKAIASQWFTSTVLPLLKQDASSAFTPAAARAVANVTAFAAADATIGTPSYSTQAWNLLIDETIGMPNNKVAVREFTEFGKTFGRILGDSGATVRVYRLNSSQAGSDYFLVDTKYTQSPSYDPLDFWSGLNWVRIWAFANRQTDFKLTGEDPNHSSIRPSLYDFAPRTTVTSSTETFTVGANLVAAAGSGSGGGVSGSYSVTRTQESVNTSVKGTHGANTLQWVDIYNGFFQDASGNVHTPATSINTFTGERLSIFQVPRTVNDDIPAGKKAGLNFNLYLESHVQGIRIPAIVPLQFYITAGWSISSKLFAPEPQFSASTNTVTVSRSRNSATNPVIVNITAQLPDGAQKLAWQIADNPLESIAAVATVNRGSGQIKIYPKSAANTSEDSGDIAVDSVPSSAADSLRDGPVLITVTIVP